MFARLLLAPPVPARANVLTVALALTVALVLNLALPAAAHAGDAGACRYVPVATLALRAGGDPSQPTVDGSINGQPAVMLIDTGMSASMLLKDAAERLGIALRSSGGYVYGVGGASVRYVAKVADFAVGSVHSGKTEMGVLGNMGMRAPFDAIIGDDFLLQMDLEIALGERQLRFFRAKDCKDAYLAYWSADAMEIAFGGTATGHANPRLIVDINGTRMEAMFDTGATSTVMTRAAAERAGILTDASGVIRLGTGGGIGDKRVAHWQAEVATFTIGSETIRHAHIGIRDHSPQGTMIGSPDVLIGTDFLRAHRVLIAMSQRRFYVSYTGGDVFLQRHAASD